MNTLVIPGCGPDGKQCACKKDMDPCKCSQAVITAECRSATGSTQLYGFTEFVNQSNPCRLYKKALFSGRSTTDPTTYLTDWSGECVMLGPESGVNHVKRVTTYVQTGGTLTQGFSSCRDLDLLTPLSLVKTKTKTIQTDLFHNVAMIELIDEDTEQMAIGRVKVTWTPWMKGVGCCTEISSRAGASCGASITFTKAELKLTAKGSPNTVAKVEVTFNQKDLKSGAVESVNVTVELWCDGAGDAEKTLTVPMVAGKKTCATWKQIQ